MRNIFLIAYMFISVFLYSQKNDFMVEAVKSGYNNAKVENKTEANEIIHLDKKKFKNLIFNYEKSKEWNYKGDIPAIIDFYADWCKPCKMVAPTLKELQKDYKGKIQIYKINTQHEKELASVFGIRGIPAFLFIPAEGEPSMTSGALPKSAFEKYITEILKVSK